MASKSACGSAMECIERGCITKRQLGFKLTWGDIGGAHRLLAMITSGRRLSRENMEHPREYSEPGELTRE